MTFLSPERSKRECALTSVGTAVDGHFPWTYVFVLDEVFPSRALVSTGLRVMIHALT